MAKYRTTVTIRGARAGDVIELDENDPGVKAQVKGGWLVPVKDKAAAKKAPAKVAASSASSSASDSGSDSTS